jgi:hypothetical protein
MGFVSYPLRGDKTLCIDKGLIKKIIPLVEDTFKSNQDFLIVLSGKEGRGKSTLARQLAWIIYFLFYKYNKGRGHFSTENSANIHFDSDDYIDVCLDSKKFTINILDEARSVINKKKSTSAESVRFTNYLSEARDQNLVHIICLPSWKDLDRYVVQHRTRTIIKVYGKQAEDKTAISGRKLDLGYFYMWGMTDEVKKAYDKPGYEYPPNPILTGEFKKTEVLTEKGFSSYNNKKGHNRRKKYGTKSIDPKKEAIFNVYNTLKDVTYDDLARCFGVDFTTVCRWVNEVKQKKEPGFVDCEK